MRQLLFLLICFICCIPITAQVATDLKKSVPLSIDIDNNDMATLQWINDDLATEYTINTISPTQVLSVLGTVAGDVNQFPLGNLGYGEERAYFVSKNYGSLRVGHGLISIGNQVAIQHNRGRCIIAIDDILVTPLDIEINRLVEDMEMDGWEVDTIQVSRDKDAPTIKGYFSDWYDADYQLSQTVLLLGHITVPYSGNTNYDGHANHQGAWVADVYYGELNGNWTDSSVNNTSPSRTENKNVPGDGKFDQSQIPGDVELEVGRIDFNNLPAFPEDEVELTRKYLNKNHVFRTGSNIYPRRAIVENNFASFDEGFGQTAWRNYVPMFGEENVVVGNYDVALETEKYLCSYACGGGSYISASGIGNTTNLWVNKEIKTVFTFTFGSYFGDWDVENNFLRSALGSGDVLTNAWSGRPVWQIPQMALGKHIGFSTRFTQNADDAFFTLNWGSGGCHMSLLGDPTLRLHPMISPTNLVGEEENGDVKLEWEASVDANNGYAIYRKIEDGNWQILEEFYLGLSYSDLCLIPDTKYTYMVKAIKLEHSASGSYFNNSLGITTEVFVDDNPNLTVFYIDNDGDGYGSDLMTIDGCTPPAGYAANDLDCDDTDASINPDADDIPNNGIDEDCDGEDMISSLKDIQHSQIKIYPNPASEYLWIENQSKIDLTFILKSIDGKIIRITNHEGGYDVSDIKTGMYLLEIADSKTGDQVFKRIVISR